MDTPLDKKLIGDQHKLPEALKAKIEAAPESPAKFMGAVNFGSFASVGNAIRGLQNPVSPRVSGAFNSSLIRQGGRVVSNRFLSRELPESSMQRMVDQGYIRDNFGGGNTRCVADQMFGTQLERQASMPGNTAEYESPMQKKGCKYKK